MIRRILIPLDPSRYTQTAIRYACEIAKLQNSEIMGMVALNIPEIEKSIGPVPAGGLYWADKLEHSRIETTKRHIEALLEKFKNICEVAGVKHSEAELQGSPSELIMYQSIFYDLVVMGIRTYYYYKKAEDPGVSLEKILLHTITPILAVPKNYVPIKKVVIAFDGSLPAARALQRFSHLAVAKDFEILLLIANPNKEDAEYYLRQAGEYLRAHGLTNVKTEWTREPIIAAMQDRFLDYADMVVIGLHSKSVIKNFFVGSLTKYLIETAQKPLLIAQ